MIPRGDNLEQRFLDAVLRWFDAVASSEWDSALAMLDEPNSYGITWTRESILRLVTDTFSAGTHFFREHGAPMFSAPATSTGNAHPNAGVCRDGSYWLDHAVPLNGHFSDLTAQFEFHPRSDGFAMVLHDLHVM